MAKLSTHIARSTKQAWPTSLAASVGHGGKCLSGISYSAPAAFILGRMSETQLILLFWGGVLGGVLLGCVAGMLGGMLWGVAIGCLVIGGTASVAAGTLAWQRWQFVENSVRVEGRLSGQSGGPVVEFRGTDGEPHQVQGLGGSQSDVGPDEAVPVRYLPSDPKQAFVDDFQNLWGGVLAFTLFGALPLAFGAFFCGLAVQESRQRRPARSRRRAKSGAPEVFEALHAQAQLQPEAPWRKRLSQNLIICGNVGVLAGIGFMLFLNDSIGEFGLGFLVIGVAMALFGVALLVRKEGDWTAPAILFIIALGFALFGGGAMLLA